MPYIPMDEDSNNALYSRDLAFFSRTAAELFDMSLEQDIYEVIGTRKTWPWSWMIRKP
jgi:hypothetical protein